MTKKTHIAVVYTHFPHYRQAVFRELLKSEKYEFSFFFDPEGVDNTIKSGDLNDRQYPLRTRRLGPFQFQLGSIPLAAKPQFDGFILLGNPYIVSSWVCALIARARGTPVYFWTHGWLRKEVGLKSIIRKTYYRLATGLLTYGFRAKRIALESGFKSNQVHVIFNSLDYCLQKSIRRELLASFPAKPGLMKSKQGKPFFLIVSRLVPEVNIEMAIEALARLSSNRVGMVVVGEGPLRTALEERVKFLGVDVRFEGSIYDERRLAELFLGAVAVVSPGKVGLLALHSLAYGTPVITHDDFDRQMPEAESIDSGVTGEFFRYGDVSDLSRKMETAVDSYLRYGRQVDDNNASIVTLEKFYTPYAQTVRIEAALDTHFNRTIQ